MAEDMSGENAPRKRGRGRPRLDAELMPRILDAAERLFAELGPVNVSIRDIAAEAGLPHSAIYRYFDSKDEVLRQVVVRGRARQVERDRAAGPSTKGAIEWIMAHNRAYALVVARLALQGETTSSLGMDPGENSARQSLDTLAALERQHPFELRRDHDPQVVMAALMALTMGYVACEEWVLDAVGLHGCDREAVRAAVDDVMESMMALGHGPRRSCE
jgi:AcrR family transcriptional regulator